MNQVDVGFPRLPGDYRVRGSEIVRWDGCQHIAVDINAMPLRKRKAIAAALVWTFIPSAVRNYLMQEPLLWAVLVYAIADIHVSADEFTKGWGPSGNPGDWDADAWWMRGDYEPYLQGFRLDANLVRDILDWCKCSPWRWG